MNRPSTTITTRDNGIIALIQSFLIVILSCFMLGSCVISSNPLNFGFRCDKPEPFPAEWIMLGAFALGMTAITFGFLVTLCKERPQFPPLLIAGMSLCVGLAFTGLLVAVFLFLGGYTLIIPLFLLLGMISMEAMALAIAKKAGLAIPTIILGTLIMPFLFMDALMLAFVCG